MHTKKICKSAHFFISVYTHLYADTVVQVNSNVTSSKEVAILNSGVVMIKHLHV